MKSKNKLNSSWTSLMGPEWTDWWKSQVQKISWDCPFKPWDCDCVLPLYSVLPIYSVASFLEPMYVIEAFFLVGWLKLRLISVPVNYLYSFLCPAVAQRLSTPRLLCYFCTWSSIEAFFLLCSDSTYVLYQEEVYSLYSVTFVLKSWLRM